MEKDVNRSKKPLSNSRFFNPKTQITQGLSLGYLWDSVTD